MPHMQFISCRKDCVESSNVHLMTRNRQVCGLHVAEMMQYQSSADSNRSTGTGYNYTRFPRPSNVEERGKSRQGSKVNNHASSSGSRPNIRNKPQNVAKTRNSSISNTLTGQKSCQIPMPALRKNAKHHILSSSDESGSEIDADAGFGVSRGLSEVRGLAERELQHGGTAPRGSGFMAFTRGIAEKKSNSGSLSRRARSQAADKMKWGETSESPSLDGRESGSAFDFDCRQGETRDTESSGESSNSSSMGGPVHDCQCLLNSSTVDGSKKCRLCMEIGCNCETERNESRQVHVSQSKGSKSNSSNRLGQLLGNKRVSACKRKSCTQGVATPGSQGTTPDGLGSRESSGAGSSYVTSLSRRNLSNLTCSSAADVLTSVSPFSKDGASHRSRNQKMPKGHSLNNRSETLRGFKLNRSSVVSSAIGCTVPMNSDQALGGSSSMQNIPDINQTSRSTRRSAPAFQVETWCSRRPASMESDSIISRGTLAKMDVEPPTYSLGCRSGSPLVSRGRNLIGSSSSSSEQSFVVTEAYVDRVSQRPPESINRSSLTVNTFANQFSTLGSEINRESSRIGVDRRSSNSNPSIVLDEPCATVCSASLSGPPPTRPPPSPPVLQLTSSVQESYSPPAFMASSSCLQNTHSANLDDTYASVSMSHGNRLARLDESYNSRLSESLVYRSVHGRQHSDGENRPRLFGEGISEILSALEHVGRDDELSYEQILMLEATLLLGGMGLNDRHRDMRLDVDNMSYEELLALEERIGNVSTGLNEETIAKCLKRRRHLTFGVPTNYVLQEIEMKCSICQEEFEENVDLGTLECGHSHHIACIKQWLLQKNQCPICKASAFHR